ncbi:hypothetical protein DRP07_08800 [Archaeoglobales archaeon]|nr:MAG: hypothetical protein DRP07_08800 [Archaeoglobales archaeon]
MRLLTLWILLIIFSFLLAGCTDKQLEPESKSKSDPGDGLENLPKTSTVDDKYAKLMKESRRYAELSKRAQKFILNIEWIKDGIDEEDIEYINSIPASFDPEDKSVDTDNGGLEDYWEVMYKGDILDSSDDLDIQLKNYIPGKGFLIFPFREEDIDKNTFKILSYFDLDPSPNIRNWMGNSVSTDPDNHGIDYDVPEGTPVVAASPGVVVEARVFPEHSVCPGALYILIDYGDYRINYGHLSKILVKKGDYVQRGQIIALSGNTGVCSARPHLHFGVHKKVTGGFIDVDPYRDVTNNSSKSLWINDNDPLILTKDGKWKPISQILGIRYS